MISAVHRSFWLVLLATCGGAPIACSDPEDLTFGALAAGTYYYVVDGYSTGTGTYTLNVSGTIQSGGYPITRVFYMLTAESAPNAADSFIEFVRGPEGDAAVVANGYLPAL